MVYLSRDRKYKDMSRRHQVDISYVGARRYRWPFAAMSVGDYFEFHGSWKETVVDRRVILRRISALATKFGHRHSISFSCFFVNDLSSIRCQRIT